MQLGDQERGDQVTRVAVPRDMDAEGVNLGRALQLLSLPREVGLHPETCKPIATAIGRFGPFILHDGIYANLNSWEEVFEIGVDIAVALLAERGAAGKGKPWQPPTLVKQLGEHPIEGGPVLIFFRPVWTVCEARDDQCIGPKRRKS